MTEAATQPAPDDHAVLQVLRQRRRSHRPRHIPQAAPLHAPIVAPQPATPGERLADAVASTVGSWTFILLQSGLIIVWLVGNSLRGEGAWDPYPFILLNLVLSFQAAYTAPAIMMSQNRQAMIDRRHAETDYEINVKAELEIELLHQKIDLMRETEILALTGAVRDLAARLERMAGKSEA